MDIASFTRSTGLYWPAGRAVYGAVFGFLFQYFVRPEISYIDENTAKPFIMTVDQQYYEYGTFVPWYSWPIIGAVIGGLFI